MGAPNHGATMKRTEPTGDFCLDRKDQIQPQEQVKQVFNSSKMRIYTDFTNKSGGLRSIQQLGSFGPLTSDAGKAGQANSKFVWIIVSP